jgi:hypothetical protein
MSRIIRSPDLTRVGRLLLTTFWLIPLETSVVVLWPGPTHPAAAQDFPPQGLGGQGVPNPDAFGQPPTDPDAMPLPSRLPKAKAVRKKARAAEKGTAKKADTKAKAKDAESGAKPANLGQLSFAKDIAPIFVANCIDCHTTGRPGFRRGKLDLTTFEKLQRGTLDDKKVIIPGKPEQSHLVLRIKGEESPRMPQGGNRVLSNEAIAKIEQWVKSGAQLDAGADPKAMLASYASTPEQMLKAKLAKMPAKERDQKLEAAALERWKQANPKLKPEIVTGDHFVIFSNLPRDRATSTLKSMEVQYGHLKRLLGSPTMDWVEKLSLYVLSNRNDFVEFIRSVEGRADVDPEVHFSARFAIPEPYLLVADPSGGKAADSSGRRRAKGKRAEEGDTGGSDRSLLGLLTEGLGSGTVAVAGRAPRWLSEGIGIYMASQVEPRSSYYRGLRQQAFQNFDQGWQTKATETLGGGQQISPADLHAVSFALVEAMMSSDFREGFPTFLHGMLEGQEKLDEVLQNVYGGNREQFLNLTGEWVAARYGRVQ